MKLFLRKYGTGEPLIIMHGLFGTSDNWNTLAKNYGEHFTTYVVDMRNHGQSPHSDEWNYDVMADDIIELMDSENIKTANIIGHSMGGKTAMFLACKFPDRVSKLVVTDIAPKYYAPHHQEIIDALKSVDLTTVSARKEVEQHIEDKIPEPGVRQFLLKSLYWNDDKQLAWRFNLDVISNNINNVGEELPRTYHYEGPTLFIRGSKSHYITDNDIDQIIEHFPAARLTTIDNAGHWIHAEQPKDFLDITMDFLI